MNIFIIIAFILLIVSTYLIIRYRRLARFNRYCDFIENKSFEKEIEDINDAMETFILDNINSKSPISFYRDSVISHLAFAKNDIEEIESMLEIKNIRKLDAKFEAYNKSIQEASSVLTRSISHHSNQNQ